MPSVSVTEPAAHGAHAGIVPLLYCPTAQETHWDWSWLVPMPGMLQTAHATVEAGEYQPAAHAVHAVAPDAASVSVVDPAGQLWQLLPLR